MNTGEKHAGKAEGSDASGTNGPGKQSSLADWAPKLVGLLIPVALGLEAYGVYSSRGDQAQAEAIRLEAAKLEAAQQGPVADPHMEARAEPKRSAK